MTKLTKPIEALYEPTWGRLNLSFSMLQSFVKAIRTGDINTLISYFGPHSKLSTEQKRALLSKSFNENHLNGIPSGTSMTNAIRLAQMLDNREVLNYLVKQRNDLPPIGRTNLGFHRPAPEEKHPEVQSSKHFNKR